MMLAMRRPNHDGEADDEGRGARVIPISDRALFERHRRGERDAFPQLVQAWRARVYGYLTRCGVPASDRDDLFQDVFLRVHRAVRTSPPALAGGSGAPGDSGDDIAMPASGSLVPWLMTITVNVVRSHFRKVGVRSVVVLDEHAGHDVASSVRGPEGELAARQTTQWIERAVLALPLEQREALVLCAIEGMEVSEAAQALGAPLDTVKTRLRRARLALADARARQGLLEQREESR
jgi:RNA polymerase sigma-70 factor (ECF subfamily)